jgi:phosphopantetheine--protein transferase-like protein
VARGWVEHALPEDEDGHRRRWDVLTDDEKDEALSLHDADRMRFLVARALLRRVLATGWGLAPKAVGVSRDRAGAVVVTAPTGVSPIFASVSHAGEWVAVAAAPTPVGIDVEQLVTLEPDDALIAKVCTRREQRILLALPVGRRRRYFTKLWTRKEAVVKATGHRRPELIDVSRSRVRGVASTARWQVHNDRSCGPGYELAWAAPVGVRLAISVEPSA